MMYAMGFSEPDEWEEGVAQQRSLMDRIAIVAGADSGTGRAIAEAFALEVADVTVAYHIDRAGAEATVDQIGSAGRRCLYFDIREEASVNDLFAAPEEKLGMPHILVNCAGVGGSEHLVETTLADFDNLLRTDLYGPFIRCREFVRQRQGIRAERGRGNRV